MCRSRISANWRAHGSAPQGLYKRYKPSTRDAIEELLSEAPRIEVILDAFPSLNPHDLEGLSVSVDRALDEMRARMKPVFLERIDSSDLIGQIAAGIRMINQINGHRSDDDEIRAGLDRAGLDPSAENIAKVRAAVAVTSAK